MSEAPRISLATTAAPELRSDATSVAPTGPRAQRVKEALARAGGGGAPDPSRYHVVEELGSGGMGRVLAVVDRVLSREVALKLTHDSIDAGAFTRFLTEARVTAGLNHPSIIRIHDLGLDTRDRPYFTMKRIRGRPWSQVLPEQTLHGRLDTFEKVAQAMAHAHSRGVVHRDLKPSNVLVADHGEVVVADWGLALVVAPGAEPESVAGDVRRPAGPGGPAPAEPGPEALGATRLTGEGGFLGTPGYAPPEQVDGDTRKMGPASDVYALGAILYQCLTGEPPFPGSSLPAILRAQSQGPSPIPASDAPPELVAIAAKTLALAIPDRYRTVREILQELDRWRRGFPVAAYPEPLPSRALKLARRHPVKVAAAAALVVSLVLLASVLALQSASLRTRAAGEVAARREGALADLRDQSTAATDSIENAKLAIETGDLARAAAEIEVAAGLFQALVLRSGVARREFPDLPDAHSEADSGAQEIRGLQVELELASARRPLVGDSLAEARRQGSTWETVLAAIRRATEAGVPAADLAAAGREALGLGPLAIRTEPSSAPFAIHRLGTDSTQPGELVASAKADGAPIELAAGGYLLVFEETPETARTILPVYLMRSDDSRRRELGLVLPGAQEIPEGFVYIPPGPWLAGEALEPRVMERGFAIARHELTWGEWSQYGQTLAAGQRPTADYTDGTNRDLWDIMKAAHPSDWSDYPLSGVSYDDLVQFCAWKSAADPRFVYEIPTADQWERAARGADGRTYPWGDTWDPARANHERHHEVRDSGRILEAAARDRSLEDRSVFGVLGLGGNVAEWSSSDRDRNRLVMGGSAFSPVERCRAWFASSLVRSSRFASVGGRMVARARTRS